jgi:hypothetical protein
MTDDDQEAAASLAVLSAMMKAGHKPKRKLSAVEYARRFAIEQALQRRRYCDAFALWQACARKACQRRQCCSGNAGACLRRALDVVPHPQQWRARQDILDATPANLGAPERAARQCMPWDLYAK